jgi:hypothetical protein
MKGERRKKMKKKLLIVAVAFMVILTLSPEAFAVNCNSPPTGSYGSAWATEYQRWCVACCGKFNMSGGNPTCTPDSNWGCKGKGSSGAAGSGLYQPFFNLGYGIGQSIGKALFGDPQEEARKRAEEQWKEAERARLAEIARQEAEAREAARQAEEARIRQETFDRLSSQLQLSEGFDGNRSGLTLMLGDDGLRPQGTSFFRLGGGTGGSNLNNDSKVVDLRPRQGYSAVAAAPANLGGTLPLIMGDPDISSNVVDLRDKKSPLVVDPKTVKGETKPAGSQHVSQTPIAVSSSGSSSTSGVDEFLFPGQRIFPKNRDKQLLNPLIELPKGESLPARGETSDEFFARLDKTTLGRKIADEEYRSLLFPTDGGKPYPRGQNPVVDKIKDEGIGQIVDIEMNRIHEACRKAVADMNAEWAEMERKGIIRPSEDLSKKEKTDVVYENAVMAAHHRVYDQLEKDIRAAKYRSEHNLWILKRFCDQTQTAGSLGGPSSKELNDPEQMKSLLGKFMNDYSGDLK